MKSTIKYHAFFLRWNGSYQERGYWRFIVRAEILRHETGKLLLPILRYRYDLGLKNGGCIWAVDSGLHNLRVTGLVYSFVLLSYSRRLLHGSPDCAQIAPIYQSLPKK